jgi:hypothetical protein
MTIGTSPKRSSVRRFARFRADGCMFPDDNDLPALAKVDRSPYRQFHEEFPW